MTAGLELGLAALRLLGQVCNRRPASLPLVWLVAHYASALLHLPLAALRLPTRNLNRRIAFPQSQRSQLHTVELAPFRLTSPLTEFQPLAALRGSPWSASHCLFRLTRSGRFCLTANAPLGHRFPYSPRRCFTSRSHWFDGRGRTQQKAMTTAWVVIAFYVVCTGLEPVTPSM